MLKSTMVLRHQPGHALEEHDLERNVSKAKRKETCKAFKSSICAAIAAEAARMVISSTCKLAKSRELFLV